MPTMESSFPSSHAVPSLKKKKPVSLSLSLLVAGIREEPKYWPDPYAGFLLPSTVNVMLCCVGGRFMPLGLGGRVVDRNHRMALDF